MTESHDYDLQSSFFVFSIDGFSVPTTVLLMSVRSRRLQDDIFLIRYFVNVLTHVCDKQVSVHIISIARKYGRRLLPERFPSAR